MTPVNLCLLGCGRVAARHARTARRLRGAVNLTFASRSPEKARAYNRRFGGGGAFGGYEEACAAWEVDAVVVCTPPAEHVAHAELAAHYRKAILLEKPAARTPQELAAIERAVLQHGVPCMVAENYFFKPCVQVMRHWMNDGEIGTPLVFALTRTGVQRNAGWRTDAVAMGGGALLEGGVHWVNLLCELGGPVRDVVAAQPVRHDGLLAPQEDTVDVLVRFAGGAVGRLLHSWNLPNRFGGLGLSKIWGTRGTITFESNGLFAALSGARSRLRLPRPFDITGSRAMLEHFIACVREGRAPAMPLAVARRDLEVVWAAYRSLASGRFESPATS